MLSRAVLKIWFKRLGLLKFGLAGVMALTMTYSLGSYAKSVESRLQTSWQTAGADYQDCRFDSGERCSVASQDGDLLAGSNFLARYQTVWLKDGKYSLNLHYRSGGTPPQGYQYQVRVGVKGGPGKIISLPAAVKPRTYFTDLDLPKRGPGQLTLEWLNAKSPTNLYIRRVGLQRADQPICFLPEGCSQPSPRSNAK